MKRTTGGRLLHPSRHETAQAAFGSHSRFHGMDLRTIWVLKSPFFLILLNCTGVSVPVYCCIVIKIICRSHQCADHTCIGIDASG